MRQKALIIPILFLFATILFRVMPHPPNIAPLGAFALFGAAFFRTRIIYLILPVVALWLSNIYIDNVIFADHYAEFVWVSKSFSWVAFSLILIALLGAANLRSYRVPKLIGITVISSLLFFAITNFGVWAYSPIYSKDLMGLLECYTLALPFLWNTIAGDLLYVGVYFGSYYLIRQYIAPGIPALAKSRSLDNR